MEPQQANGSTSTPRHVAWATPVQLENYDIVEIMESVSFAAGLNDLNVLFKPK